MIDSKYFVQVFLGGKLEEAKQRVREEIDKGEDAEILVNQGMIKAMDEIGAKFSNDEIFLPEMMVSAKCMQACLAILKPFLVDKSTSVSRGETIVMGTVKGDLHDIGKNLVGIMLEGAGYEVIDIGVDASPDKFIQAAKEHNAKLVGISALLTTTKPQVKVTIDSMKAEGLSGNVKTIVGGACMSEKHAKEIGADSYARDAASAVISVRELF